MLGWLALIVAALTGLFVLFQSPGESIDPIYAGSAAIAAIVLLALLYLVSLKARQGDSRWFHPIILVAFFCAALAGAFWLYTNDLLPLRREMQAKGPLQPTLQSAAQSVSVLIRRNSDGNFATQGQINGTDASLLFDTGASVVMLKPTDAERAGVAVKSLSFTVPVQTANGTVYAAPVRIRSVAIGLLKVEDVEALVAKPGSLNENLLGMSFLRRLASYDLTGDFLTLRE
jgi:aspartyl protease family protein